MLDDKFVTDILAGKSTSFHYNCRREVTLFCNWQNEMNYVLKGTTTTSQNNHYAVTIFRFYKLDNFQARSKMPFEFPHY